MEISVFTKFCLYMGHLYLCFKLTQIKLKKSRCSREELLEVISKSLISGESKEVMVFDDSYFSELFKRLLSYRQYYGADITNSLRKLRNLIIYEGQLSRKLASEMKQAIGQFALLFLMTWVFVLSTYWQLKIIFPLSFYGLILGWQAVGVFVFFFFLKCNRTRLFKDYKSFHRGVFTLQSLLGIGPSVQQVIDQAKLSELRKSDKRFSYVVKSLESFLQGVQLHGDLNTHQLSEIGEELDFLWQQDQKKFQRIALRLKFITLIGFFLLSYFFYLFALFQKLLP